MPLPEGLPASLGSLFTHCIWLDSNPFYEVFTIAIFEYLLKDPSPKKVSKINKLKNLVCNDKFMPFSSYTKGLLLKGLQLMLQSTETRARPVAQALLGCEKLAAFTECWKEMIAESSRYISPDSEGGNKSAIAMLATFFDVDLKFYTLRDGQC
jgi:hypothetical protein